MYKAGPSFWDQHWLVGDTTWDMGGVSLPNSIKPRAGTELFFITIRS